jgi:hypothetical protein
MTPPHPRLGLGLAGRRAGTAGIERPARNAARPAGAFALFLLALTVTALPFATPALGQLPAADKAAFYRMRKQAIERSLQNWRQSPMPGAAKEIARLQKEESEIDAKLNLRPPRPPGACGGCPDIDPSWCGLNCTGR